MVNVMAAPETGDEPLTVADRLLKVAKPPIAA